MFENITNTMIDMQRTAENLVVNNEIDPVYLQTALNALIGANLTVDGDIGPATIAAIKQFQAQAGLTADGIAGPNTKLAIVSAMAELERQAKEAQNQPTGNFAMDLITEKIDTIRQDAAEIINRTDLTNAYIQESLNKLSEGTMNLTVDGILGPASINAIKLFQQAHGLEADGIVGQQTKEALLRAMVDYDAQKKAEAEARQRAFEEQERLRLLELERQAQAQKEYEDQRQREVEAKQQPEYNITIPDTSGNAQQRLNAVYKLYQAENAKVTSGDKITIPQDDYDRMHVIFADKMNKILYDFIKTVDFAKLIQLNLNARDFETVKKLQASEQIMAEWLSNYLSKVTVSGLGIVQKAALENSLKLIKLIVGVAVGGAAAYAGWQFMKLIYDGNSSVINTCNELIDTSNKNAEQLKKEAEAIKEDKKAVEQIVTTQRRKFKRLSSF